LNYIRTNGAYSEKDYEYINTQMDIENYIEYQITRIYSRTTDWPGNNIKFWRLKTEKFEPDAPYGNDGRWRWLFYDADSGFGLEGGPESYKHNTLVHAIDSLIYGSPSATFLMRNMVRNERFSKEFVIRFADLLNTAFTSKRVSDHILLLKSRISDEMLKHIQRWNEPVNISQWNAATNVMIKFGEERSFYVRQHIQDFFNYPGQYNLNLDVSDNTHGYIKVNTVNINPKTPGVDSIPYPWAGIYFKTVPVKLEAKEYHGFLFNRWELKDSISYSPTITIDPNADFAAKAYFEIDTNYQYVPKPHILANCNYEFKFWSPSSPKETYPNNMIFPYMNYEDPRLNAEIDSFTTGSYNLISKTRINGLNDDGVAFLNSGSSNPGYPETRLGGAIVGLNTENVKEASLKWTGGTVQANSLVYHIRLQYRIGDEGEFKNLVDRNGIPVEYKRNDTSGHFKVFDEIQLPKQLMGQKYVQLYWRYYFTGLKLDEKSSARDQLRIDDIVIRQGFIDSIYTKSEYETTISANQNGVSYTWFKCENDSLKEVPSNNTYQLDITKPGLYAVAIQYKTCSDTSECFYAFVKDQLALKSNITASIYPNPVKDKLTVTLGNDEEGITASIIDMQGRIMGNYYSGRSNQLTINTLGLSSGVYILLIKTQKGEITHQKFVRQ
jgi:hypothetical protein